MAQRGMVHALHEAYRVLKPGGLLIDLRPAAVHREVGITVAGRYRRLGAMRERFDDDRAANRAVAAVVRRGLFRHQGRDRFECDRIMDRLAEFRAWLDEFVSWGNLPPHTALVRRVEQAVREAPARAKIVVRGPLDLGVLQ